MNFYKMNGTGNDFIVINNIEEQIPENKLGELAKHLCARRFSIGADGLMAVCKSERTDCDYRMLFFNADGSKGEMCGNGARCICRYADENGLLDGHEVQRIETEAGVVEGARISPREYRILMPEAESPEFEIKLETSLGEYVCDYVKVGVPHVLMYRSGICNMINKTQLSGDFGEEADINAELTDLRELAREIRRHSYFESGTNVNFYDLDENGEVCILTFERGVENFTLACGTGSTAAAYLLHEKGEVQDNTVKLEMLGGALEVNIEGEHLYLSGTTNIVAIGIVTDDELKGFI